MRRRLILFSSLIPFLLHAQETGRTQEFRMHAGISALPVLDVLHQQPDNRISGAAVTANFGCFIHPRLSFGINPYYARVLNVFPTNSVTVSGGQQDTRLFGLNVNLRGYFISRSRFSVFMLASGGFGVMKELSSFPYPGLVSEPRLNILPVASFFVGPGVNWNFSPMFAVEANLPVAVIYSMDESDYGRIFTTLLPTFGLQFYFGKTDK
jgi:hypothetical protein